MSFNYIDMVLIVFSQVIILFLFHLFIRKDKKKHDVFKDKLELLNSIFANTKHDKIVSLDELKKRELKAHRINVFSQDIYRDVKDSGQFSNETYNVGTFFKTVTENLNNKKAYNYFIKRDANFKHSLISFFKSHKFIEKVKFIIIPSEKYYFYDEVYLYEYENGLEAQAYEFLPSISNEESEKLYFLKLDSNQVSRLLIIRDNLLKKYEETSINDVREVESKIQEFGSI